MMRKIWLIFVTAALTGAAWALDPPRPAPVPTTAGASEQPAATPATPPPAAGEQAPPQPETATPEAAARAPDKRQTGPTPQRFEPTEEVRADFPVSFPSDI
jgi:hypothetical protein